MSEKYRLRAHELVYKWDLWQNSDNAQLEKLEDRLTSALAESARGAMERAASLIDAKAAYAKTRAQTYEEGSLSQQLVNQLELILRDSAEAIRKEMP